MAQQIRAERAILHHTQRDDQDTRLCKCTFSAGISSTRSQRWSWSNSVSVVSAYGLEDRAIKVRSPTQAKGSFPVTSKSRPALGPTQPPVQWVGYWKVLSPEVKSGQGMTLTTHPHLVQRSSRSYIYSLSLPVSA
jgi:hypothetical protein